MFNSSKIREYFPICKRFVEFLELNHFRGGVWPYIIGYMLNYNTHSDIAQRAAIYELGVKNQLLMSRALDLGFITEAKQLQLIDRELFYLLKQTQKRFDFVGHVAGGKLLLVGEGNLSFALSLTNKKRITPSHITACTFEKAAELSDVAIDNASKLRVAGATVLHGIDATKLHLTTGSAAFDHIIFQFTHAGSREPINGHNPNFILVRDFLKSAIQKVKRNGSVLISAVDTPHYHGAFQFEEVASITGFQTPLAYAFDPEDFPGYHHTMTHQDGDALHNHDAFATWIFEPK